MKERKKVRKEGKEDTRVSALRGGKIGCEAEGEAEAEQREETEETVGMVAAGTTRATCGDNGTSSPGRGSQENGHCHHLASSIS